MDDLILRAAGYGRVFTREQLDGFSLDAQANSIRFNATLLLIQRVQSAYYHRNILGTVEQKRLF